jgi:hypothetical protein
MTPSRTQLDVRLDVRLRIYAANVSIAQWLRPGRGRYGGLVILRQRMQCWL